MPVMAVIPSIVGSFFYGVIFSVGLFAIYLLRGAPGSTGMEILIVPVFTTVATTAGTAAALISLSLPRASFPRSDSFVLLALAAVALQTATSLVSFQLYQTSPHQMLLHAMALSGPFEWRAGAFNWNWVYTLPLTFGICSPWFRGRFDG